MSNTSTSLPTDCGQLMSYSLSKPRICATKSVVEKMTVPTTCLSGLRKMYTKNAMNAMIPRAGIASDALDLHLEHLPPQCRYPLVQSAHTGPSYPTSHAFSPVTLPATHDSVTGHENNTSAVSDERHHPGKASSEEPPRQSPPRGHARHLMPSKLNVRSLHTVHSRATSTPSAYVVTSGSEPGKHALMRTGKSNGAMSKSDKVVSREHVTRATYARSSSPRRMDPRNVATPRVVAEDVEPLISNSWRACDAEVDTGSISHVVVASSLVTAVP